MANYQLGPVIGKVGGQMEIVEQQIADDGPVSIPVGWGSAYAGFDGSTFKPLAGATVLGQRFGSSMNSGASIGGFRLMTAGENLGMSNAQGTLTFIRID